VVRKNDFQIVALSQDIHFLVSDRSQQTHLSVKGTKTNNGQSPISSIPAATQFAISIIMIMRNISLDDSMVHQSSLDDGSHGDNILSCMYCIRIDRGGDGRWMLFVIWLTVRCCSRAVSL
jgi:hypothetical protein